MQGLRSIERQDESLLTWDRCDPPTPTGTAAEIEDIIDRGIGRLGSHRHGREGMNIELVRLGHRGVCRFGEDLFSQHGVLPLFWYFLRLVLIVRSGSSL